MQPDIKAQFEEEDRRLLYEGYKAAGDAFLAKDIMRAMLCEVHTEEDKALHNLVVRTIKTVVAGDFQGDMVLAAAGEVMRYAEMTDVRIFNRTHNRGQQNE